MYLRSGSVERSTVDFRALTAIIMSFSPPIITNTFRLRVSIIDIIGPLNWLSQEDIDTHGHCDIRDDRDGGYDCKHEMPALHDMLAAALVRCLIV
jgi:hypothetical protein